MKNRILFCAVAALALTACGGGGDGRANPSPPVAKAPPTIGKIDNVQTQALTASQPISITLSDDTTPADALAIEVSSDAADIVSANAVLIQGAGNNRTLLIEPDGVSLGDARITITVTDQDALTASRSFVTTVLAKQVSFQTYSREIYDDAQTDTPRNVNLLSFDQDADTDGFIDLLSR